MVVYQGHNSGGNLNYNAFFYENCQWYLHFHKNFELAFVLDGQTELALDGQNFLLSQGEFALIFPHQLHAYRTPERSRVWIAVFSDDFVSSFARQMENKRPENPVFTCEVGVLTFLRQQLITDKKQDALMLKAALYAVCSQFLTGATLVDAARDPRFAQQTVEYVAQHFREEITLLDLAQAFGYEYHYVSRQFHRHFSMHFKQFLNIYRTEFARDLLLQTDLSVTEIALRSGFQNCRSFNRVFLEQMGMTPTAFRNRSSLNRQITYCDTPIV